MAESHERLVLSGILPNRKDNLLYLMLHLERDHFREQVHKNLFVMIERYYDVAGGVLTRDALTDIMQRSGAGEAATVLMYEQAYDEISNLEIADHEFRYSVDALKELRAHQLTGEAFALGFEILERGAEVGRETLQGAKEARTYVIDQFSKVDKLDNLEVAPEGDMMHEYNEVLDEYMARKTGKTGMGVMSGIGSIDKATGGYQKGELSLVVAYTNQGKTQYVGQTAWHASVHQGLNVFFATSETSRATVRRRIIARHSREPQFGLEHGLDVNDIKNGSLSVSEEKALVAVIKDFDTNPNYGKCYLTQVPRGATLAYYETRMSRQQNLWNIDLSIMDYLALLKPEKGRQSEREEFNDILRGTKTFATSFNDGKGVPIISPWQLKRDSYLDALRTGVYGLGCLSDTTEAEKSSDQIMAILRQPEQKHDCSMHFLKMRDGEIPNPINLTIDYRNAYFADKKGGLSGHGSSGPNSFGI